MALQVALGILKRTGYSEVTTVVDGQQAMDELHRRGGADAFDIILTDLHMPHKVRCTVCRRRVGEGGGGEEGGGFSQYLGDLGSPNNVCPYAIRPHSTCSMHVQYFC